MMNRLNDDLVERLATPGQEADEVGAVRRKKRFMSAITRLEADHAERARMELIAARVGIFDQSQKAARLRRHARRPLVITVSLLAFGILAAAIFLVGYGFRYMSVDGPHYLSWALYAGVAVALWRYLPLAMLRLVAAFTRNEMRSRQCLEVLRLARSDATRLPTYLPYQKDAIDEMGIVRMLPDADNL